MIPADKEPISEIHGSAKVCWRRLHSMQELKRSPDLTDMNAHVGWLGKPMSQDMVFLDTLKPTARPDATAAKLASDSSPG